MDVPVNPTPTCRLIPGFRGLLLQSLLMGFAVLTLVLKKRFEDSLKPKKARTWTNFLLDSSKQLIGGLWVHVLNLALSVRLKHRTELGDSCDWYFANIFVDCTIGTGIEYLLFAFLIRFVIPFLFSDVEVRAFESGRYEDTRSYFKQLSVWLLVVSGMKVIVYAILKHYRDWILSCSDSLLDRWQDAPDTKLFVVMVVTPLVMNSVQLWIIDNLIKAKPVSVDLDAAKLLTYHCFPARVLYMRALRGRNI